MLNGSTYVRAVFDRQMLGKSRAGRSYGEGSSLGETGVVFHSLILAQLPRARFARSYLPSSLTRP